MTTDKNKKNTFDNKYLLVWFDNLKGIQLDATNANDIAEWVGPNARVLSLDGVKLVGIETNRGDVIMYIGDYITVDAENRFKIVRISEADPKQPAIERNVKTRSVKYENSPKPSDVVGMYGKR